jgi:hypothetical protein
MEGKDSSGRRVSLLNGPPRPAATPLVHTRTSSFATTSSRADSYAASSHEWSPNFSPRTPDLFRSDSWSSSQHSADPSSPRTPSSHPDSSTPALEASQMRSLSHPEFGEYYATRNGSLPELLPGKASSETADTDPEKPIKKRHPCGLAAKTGCDKMFTTSGHAARHAKVHTGEKETPCPECGKHFARVDNMKQHLKTHKKDGRSRSNSHAGLDSKKPKLAKANSIRSERGSLSDLRTDAPGLAAQQMLPLFEDSKSASRPSIPSRSGAYLSYSAVTSPVSTYTGGASAGGLEALASACQISTPR